LFLAAMSGIGYAVRLVTFWRVWAILIKYTVYDQSLENCSTEATEDLPNQMIK